MPFENYVCRHMQLTKSALVQVIREKNLSTFEQVQDETDVATICGSCAQDVDDILQEELKLRENSK